MKKLIASLIILTTMVSSIFAHGGMMSGEKDLRVSKTKWFDIIYPARCEKAATLLYENADRIYEEIAESYGYPAKFRLPVVICPGVEQFNGYMSNGYYNHIVLYDTAMIEELAVFTDTFLNLFKHECIHAYTFNLKNDGWTTISKIMGDAASINMLVISSGLAEGATVSGESAQGEGRLNDEYARQMVRQAKIEDHFPDFYDVQGARDAYPANSFYYFNGAFNEWLQTKYGIKKYAKFWYKCCNVSNFSQNAAFREVYNMKIQTAWRMFRDDYKIPEVPANPVEAGQVKDFFNQPSNKYTSKNNAGALYTQLSSSDKGIVYIDEISTKAYYISYEDLQKASLEGSVTKPKKLFTCTTMFDLNMSKEGRYIALSTYDYTKANVRTLTKIYDMETGKFFTLKDHGYYEPSVVKAGNEYYVIRQGYETPNYTIRADKLIFNEKGHICGSQEYAKTVLPLNVSPFNFTDLGDGTFAFIRKSGVVYTIEILDPALNVLKVYEAPKERMVIRYISLAGDTLLFSWTAPGIMPRLGSLSLADGTYSLQEDDISGGVYYPVAIPGENNYAFIGNFYQQNRLFTSQNIELSEIYSSVEPVETKEPVETTIGIQPQSEEIPYKPLKVFPYFRRGLLLPISSLTTTSYSPNFRGSYNLPLGITYITNDPWDSVTLELDAGYGFNTNSAGLNIAASGSNGTGAFQWQLQSGTEFYKKGWKKVTGSASVSEQYSVGNGYIIGQAAAQVNYGKTDQAYQLEANELADLLTLFTPGLCYSEDVNNYTLFSTGALLGYTNIRKTGPGKYERGGFKVISNLYYTFWNNATQKETYYNGMDIELYSIINIPKLIPIDCKAGMGYNLPSYILLDLFPSDIQSGMISNGNYKWAAETFKASLPVATFGMETLLFGCDIQKATSLHYLYLNDIQITTGYAGIFVEDTPSYGDFRFLHPKTYINKIGAGEVHYEDYLGLRVSLSGVINKGRLASAQSKNSLYFEAGVAGLAGSHKSAKPLFTFGLDSSLF